MKIKTNVVRALAVLILIAGVAALNSYTTKSGNVSVRQSEIDSLRNEIKMMTSGNAKLAKNLATIDTLDYTVSS
jgi:single-stranded DNA-binding protein